jgi:ATP-dependent Clp protease ATP-binding subunit ClpC
MFERYDEPARRTLFFARFEASRLGVPSIETEHLLLGLMREPRGPAGTLLFALPLRDIRKELERDRAGEKILESVEIPFSVETKRVLHYAREEADELTHGHIGPEHLLLGLLRETDCRAASTLARHGMRLEGTREKIRELGSARAGTLVPKTAVQAQLDQIIESTHLLYKSLEGDPDVAFQVHLLLLELEMLKSLLDGQQ